MKRIFTLVLATILSVSATFAQDYSYDTDADANSQQKSNRPKSGLEIDYLVSGDTNAVGANLVLGFLALGGEYSSESNLAEGTTESYFWRASAGINKRAYLIGGFLFLDLRVGAFYQNSTVEYDPSLGLLDDTAESYGAYGYPRVGIRLLSNITLTAGYKFSFVDFKFDQENMYNTTSLGIAFLF